MSAGVWFDQARDDLKAAVLLRDNKHYSQSVWFASQTIEKAQKALLLSMGLRLTDSHMKKRYSHVLKEIAGELPREFGDALPTERLVEVQGLAEACRYPSSATGRAIAPCSNAAFSDVVAADVVGTAADVLQWAEERARWAVLGLKAVQQAAEAAGLVIAVDDEGAGGQSDG